MTVYVDRSRYPLKGHLMCHMLADTEAELHAMADKIGQPRSRFQRRASTPHYDINVTQRALAIEAGAVDADRKTIVAVIRKIRDNHESFYNHMPKKSAQLAFEFS